jgi:hypothetical protein
MGREVDALLNCLSESAKAMLISCASWDMTPHVHREREQIFQRTKDVLPDGAKTDKEAAFEELQRLKVLAKYKGHAYILSQTGRNAGQELLKRRKGGLRILKHG